MPLYTGRFYVTKTVEARLKIGHCGKVDIDEIFKSSSKDKKLSLQISLTTRDVPVHFCADLSIKLDKNKDSFDLFLEHSFYDATDVWNVRLDAYIEAAQKKFFIEGDISECGPPRQFPMNNIFSPFIRKTNRLEKDSLFPILTCEIEVKSNNRRALLKESWELLMLNSAPQSLLAKVYDEDSTFKKVDKIGPNRLVITEPDFCGFNIFTTFSALVSAMYKNYSIMAHTLHLADYLGMEIVKNKIEDFMMKNDICNEYRFDAVAWIHMTETANAHKMLKYVVCTAGGHQEVSRLYERVKDDINADTQEVFIRRLHTLAIEDAGGL